MIAILSVIFAAAVRWGLDPWLAGRAHYLVFIVPVFIAAIFGGPLPAIFAALLSILAVELLDQAPLSTPSATAEFLVFAFATACVIWLVHLITQLRLQSAHDEGTARRGEENATQLAGQLGLLIDGLHGHAIVMLDGDGRVTVWSKGAERLLGWSKAEAVGRPGSDFYPSVAGAAPARDLSRARADGGFDEDGMRRHKDGSSIAVHVSFAALHHDPGGFRGYAQLIRPVDKAAG